MQNKKIIFAISSVVLIALFAIGAYVYKQQQIEKLNFLASENSQLFVRDYSPIQGAEDAKVYLTEFLDPECESCRALYPVVKEIMKENEGKVKLVIRYAPFHKNSREAIRVLEAARKQDKYWQALELLFYTQPMWGNHHNPKPELIYEYLPNAGIDVEKIKEDMKDPEIEKIINQDFLDLRALNVRATPTFFVNGRPLENFGVQYLKDLIREEVEKNYPTK